LPPFYKGGRVGSNKGAVVSRSLQLDPITPKDKAAFEIGLAMGIKILRSLLPIVLKTYGK